MLQVLLAHADAINRHDLDRLASPEALDGTLRAAVAETRTDVDRDLVAEGLRAVQAGAYDDGLVVEAARHIDERVGVLDARTLADRHPIAALAPPTAVQQLAGVDPRVDRLTGTSGMKVVGAIFGQAAWRAAFAEALRVIAQSSLAERRLLLSETLDCCSHRLDAWLTSAATRRLADLRARTGRGVFLGAYGMIQQVTLSTPTPEPEVDGRAVVHDPRDGGFVHAPGLNHAATAGVLRSGRLAQRRGAGDPGDEPLDLDLSSTRMRDALSLLEGMRRGQSLGALLGYRLERRLHERSGGGLELDRFIYVLRTLAPLRPGKLIEPGQPAEESLAASNVVDGLRLMEMAAEAVRAALVDGPGDLTYLAAGAWIGPRVVDGIDEADAVLAAIAELDQTHDAVADLLLAESVHQLVSGNPARAAAAMDVLGAGEAVPPEPDVTATPRTGISLQHRLAILVPDAVAAAPAGWDTGTPRALAEPRLEAWAEHALAAAPEVVTAAGLSALDVLYDADGDTVATSTLLTRVRAVRPDVEPAALASTWVLAGMLRALLVAARPLRGSDLGRAVEESAAGRLPDAEEILARAVAARDALLLALADAEGAPDSAVARLAPFGVRRPPAAGPGPTPEEEALTVEAMLIEARRRVAEAGALLERASPELDPPAPRPRAELAGQALATLFGAGFVAAPLLLPPAAGETDPWADAVGPAGVSARPGADVRPWLQRAGALRPGAAAYGESVLVREAYGTAVALRVAQTPAAAYPTLGRSAVPRRPPADGADHRDGGRGGRVGPGRSGAGPRRHRVWPGRRRVDRGRSAPPAARRSGRSRPAAAAGRCDDHRARRARERPRRTAAAEHRAGHDPGRRPLDRGSAPGGGG